MSVQITVDSPTLGRVSIDLDRPAHLNPERERALIAATLDRAVEQIRRAYQIPEVQAP